MTPDGHYIYSVDFDGSVQIENKEKKDVMQQRLYKLRERILYKRIF